MKNILVTGMSRGMGKSMTELLVLEGYFVHGVYNTNSQVAEEMKQDLKNVEIHQCDLSNRQQTMGLIEELKEVKLDGIVNSAGVFLDTGVNDFNDQDWDKVFEVNMTAPMLLVQGLANSLNEHASVVNISSIDGMTGSISGIAYSASKAALINITQSLANALADKKIRVNCISPGWIGDGMQAPQEILDAAADYNPLKRVGTYEEIANTALFLLSDKASYINGTNIVVDGGEGSTGYLYKLESELL